MRTWKCPVLFVAIAAVTMLASDAHAQQLFGQQSSPGNVGSKKSANYIAPSNQAKRAIGMCSHRSNCQYCCYFPSSSSSTCVFDIEWCGQ
jgi:hypothetical protein